MYCLGILKSVDFKINIIGRKYHNTEIYTVDIQYIELTQTKKRAQAECIFIWLVAENFMSGYRIVFDRERMILGWKRSDCK